MAYHDHPVEEIPKPEMRGLCRYFRKKFGIEQGEREFMYYAVKYQTPWIAFPESQTPEFKF